MWESMIGTGPASGRAARAFTVGESAAPAMAAVPINSRREIMLIPIPFVLEPCRSGQPSGLGDGYIAVGCFPADVKFGGVGGGVFERQAHHFLGHSHGLGLH